MHAYVALDDRLLLVRGGRPATTSTGWRVAGRIVGHDLECVDASPSEPDRVFAGTVGSGLLRSIDGGETWNEVGEFDDRITAVTVSPHDPDDVWVGTEPSGVYRSTDGGRTWEHRDGLTDLPSADRWSFPPRPHTHHVRWLAIDPRDPEVVYVAIEAGAFVRTTDGGATWEPHPDGARRDNHTVAVHPDAPDRVYTAAGDGYAESFDGGESWEYPQDGLDRRYVWGLAVDPGDPGTVVVSAASGARSAHTPDTAESYVYRRTGNSWTIAMEGLPEARGTTRAVLDAGLEPGEFVAVTNRGFFVSDDGAASWTGTDLDWPESYRKQVARGVAVVR